VGVDGLRLAAIRFKLGQDRLLTASWRDSSRFGRRVETHAPRR
jgi:hypothetical protein